ncbi:V-type ATP synthase subunit I [Thioalkalivibrio nitratireducens DSM 14787]|uniref:V-type ATP synthase subunit I n=1 Tax=Thioalkalivibrio nitratireducens (strain DSM 14787 / UNIQEM 213 / ALEN2) TaxID=1255043 RepID=L0E0T0_THIND|nr:V-type ATPase 116kDa subunit family protein [Thioalkalivibrio nitratireducens]AGA35429.1 V-type ATP synthase subunit I [Thioalkalivibrio nitratireducens DSM 14787]
MRHVRLLVLREDLPQASLTLADTESFHPDPRAPQEQRLTPLEDCRYQKLYQQARSRLDKIRQVIPVPDADLREIRVVPLEELSETNAWLGEAWESCLQHQERSRKLAEQARLLEEQEAALANFSELHVDLGALRAHKRFLDLFIGVVPRENVDRLQGALGLAGHLLFKYMERGGNAHVVIAGPAGERETELQSLLATAGFTAIPLPQGLDDSPEAIQAEQRAEREHIERARRELEQEVEACAASFRDRLARAETVLTLAEPFVTLDPAIRSAGHLACIAGWVPAEALPRLERRLEQTLPHPFSMESRKPRSDERPLVPSVPVRHRLLAPFAMLVKQYGVPRYGEIDPTFLFTITFLLMFGTMFGDVGHGGVLALLAWLFRRKLGRFYPFGVLAGLSSVVFGFVFGSVFGYKDILPALWMSPLYDPILMLQLALGWGVLFLTLACSLTIYNRFAVGEHIAAVFGHHGLVNLVFYLALVWGGVSLGATGAFGLVPAALVIAALAALAVYNWFHLDSPIGEKILVVLIETLETVIGYISNTLSFLRVAAFSINHVALAIAVLTLAGMMGAVGHVLMVIFGNIFVIVLEGVIVTIQVMRLQYFEGFSRYFSADGREFAPVRLRRPPRPA